MSTLAFEDERKSHAWQSAGAYKDSIYLMATLRDWREETHDIVLMVSEFDFVFSL